MRFITLNCFFILFIMGSCQSQPEPKSFQQDLKEYWGKLNAEMRNSKTSPLEMKERLTFDSIARFQPDELYRIDAFFIENKDPQKFGMKTTTDRLPEYIKYGEIRFKLKESEFTLNVYQNMDLKKDSEYSDYLFIPFTDLTNGVETYGGGRYLDIKIPDSENVILDFNRAYNPYCVYNYNYSCPVPPPENHLDIRIEAGALNYPVQD